MNEENKMQEIVNRIKNRRNELGLSYQDLANKTGMSKSTLQRYETGAIKNMPLDKIEILARALNVEPAYLMGWKDKQEKLSYAQAVVDFAEPREAIKFILSQPTLMDFGGYDLKNMSDEEILAVANDMLFAMQLSLNKVSNK